MAAERPSVDWRGAIEALYGELERRPVERDCCLRADCCRFRLTGRTPLLTRGEALHAAAGVRAWGRKKIEERADGACPLLGRDGCCAIYRHRPFGCRTHYCEAAGGIVPRKAVADLIRRLDELDEALGGEGPRPLFGAVRDALLAR